LDFFAVMLMRGEALFKHISDQRLIFAVTLILSVIVGYQLSALIWKLIPQAQDSTAPVAIDLQQSEQGAPELSTRQMVDRISAQYLFGRAAVVQQTKVVQDAPKSSLNYKIRGIYYSSDEAIASIILEKNSNTTRFYRLGDEIDPNIFIQQIQPDHVIISRSGKLEKLVLEKPKMDGQNTLARRASSSLPASASTQVLKSYKRRYANNPMALARRFKATPVTHDGRNVGYKLKALRGEQLLKKLGLSEDDVFIAVNGIGLDKPFQALDALKSLTTASEVSLTVLRNGNEETLDFSL
jgi:general secretion pathway protein C